VVLSFVWLAVEFAVFVWRDAWQSALQNAGGG